MDELSQYLFEPLWTEGEFVLSRSVRDAALAPLLVMAPVLAQPALESLQRLAHAYALREALEPTWAACPLALGHHQGQPTLVLTDPGGEVLARLVGQPWEVTPFLRVAIGLAVALGRLHVHGLIHKDVKPANVLTNAATGDVWLTGFGIASRLPRERQAPTPPEVIAGTLAYMAPEQTGRMNRSIDARSDLYALGITLYQMLTGSLPFTAADPMEWVHCHIARQPVPPRERVEHVPAPVSALIMKLLAKLAEERYQTAGGVERDLRRCLAAWEARGDIDDFPLGQQDTPDRLLIPEKLYGRAREVETLIASFDRIVKSGAPELVLVSGYSGIGKSSVVNELHKVLVPPRGLFVSGKFDQYKRDIPYSTLVQALQSLVRPLLGTSDTELSGWRDTLREALGPNGRLIVEVVPELKLIIGEQPPVPELPPQDAQRRFQLVFRRFIGVFARPEHPLALLLDDLQWFDAATLDVLEDLLTQADVPYLMLIGAYRDNEVGAAHPLRRKLDAITKAGAKIEEITLEPLARDDLGQLIADALRCESQRAAPLAWLVHEKTGGNPFFAIQFIAALAEEGLLSFDRDAARWSWDLHRIRAKGYTDNVVDLMVGRLTRLPAETQTALQQLACLGHAAEIPMLSIVLGTSAEQVHAALWEAVCQGLVERRAGAYRFVHDRVQEAAYSLIPEALRAEAHLRIGRLLAAQTTLDKRDEAIFEIVNQLDRGAALITSRDEREDLAELNLLAGQRAKASTAYAAALTYLIAGAALLPEDGWARRHELAFALEINRAECEFLTGELAAAEERLAALAARAADAVEQGTVACLRVDLYTALDQSSRAIAVALDYLRHRGIEWSPHPTDEEARREYERIWSTLRARPIEALVELPLMSDPASLATLDVLTKLATPAGYTDAKLFSLAICRSVNLSLEVGNSDASCVAYVRLGMVAGSPFGNYKAGYRFGHLGYKLVEQHGLNRFQARTYTCFGSFVLPWTRHVRAGRDLVHRAFEAANKNGDISYAAYCGNHLNTNLLAAGDPLVDVQREAEQGLAFAQKARFGLVIDTIATQLGLIRTLRGLTPTFGSFDDNQFDELRIERRFSENADLARAECWYWVRKLQARFFAGDYAAAIEASSRAQRLLWTSPSFFETAEYQFYGALSRAAFCDTAAAEPRQQHLEALAAHYRQLQVWAENCPDNFENRAALVGAEIARLEGRELDAERLYEEAIRSARKNDFVHNEAVANELAARFYAARGFETIAHAYLRNARYCYLRWGADGKVRQLDARYPHLRHDGPFPGPTSTIEAPVESLDLVTVLKVSQAVSGEIVFEKLLDTLMRTAIEHAGAERGLLLLPCGVEQRIEAEATISGDTVIVHVRGASVTAATLPESIVQYVVRTHESVMLGDASMPHPFAADPYLRQHHVRSLLCVPLINQATLIGVLYLENHLTPHVFTPPRIAVLRLLASQAAIALENTRLYGELKEREAKIRRLVDANLIGICLWHRDGQILEANDAFFRLVGYSREEFVAGHMSWREITPDTWRAATEQALAELAATGSCAPYEKEYVRKDGRRVPVLVGVAVFEGKQDEGVAFVLDLTERKRAEEERQAHLGFLEAMDQVNRAIQSTNDLKQMMSDVLDAVLTVFQGDRAWLVYPCDPDARWHGVKMQRTRPEFPGLVSVGLDLPVDPEIADVLRIVRAASGPVRFGPGAPPPLPATLAQRLGIQSQIVMALYPKGDQPYMFGLSQCAYPRVWTPQEERLFQEIGRRLEDALTSLLMVRTVRDSERKLEEAQRLTHVGYWERDPETDRITWSDETYRIFGLQPQARLLHLAQLPSLIHPEDQQRMIQAVAEALRGGRRYDVEYRVVRPTGEVRLVHSQGDVLRDESGRPRRMFGTVQDITERKRAEQRLVVQHTVTQILAEAATLSAATPHILQAVCECLDWDLGTLWRLDRQAGVLRCVALWQKASVAAPHFVAASRASTFRPGVGFPGRVWASRAPVSIPDVVQNAQFVRASFAAREGLHAACGFPILLSDEVLGVMEFFSREQRQLDPDLLPLMATIGSQIGQFIERTRAEDALRASEASLAEGQQLSHTGSWRWHVPTGEVRGSAEHGRIFGFDPAADPRSHLHYRERAHPDDRPALVHVLDTAIRDQRAFQHEYRIVLPDGVVKHVQLAGRPDTDASGALEFAGTTMDITERKRAEEALHTAQAELAHMARLTIMGELTAAIAHEITQPLGAMVNSANACVRWLAAQNLERAQQSALRVVADGQRAGAIITQIRALAQKAPPHKDWFDLNATIREVLTLARSAVHRHGVVVETHLAAAVPRLLGDRIQLQQVLLNLLMNAIEAMSGVSAGPRTLWVSAELAAETEVVVTVRDAGPGIDPQALDRLFDAFYTTKPHGLGLGLAISRRLIEAHGGRLWATPNTGPGVTFQFTLPAGGEQVS